MSSRPPEEHEEQTADPLLATEEGRVECLLGNEAIVRGALEAGVGFACGYPGTPSSEVTDSFARLAAARGIVFEYSVNEKVAVEMAFAASLSGARSICAMKHLGLSAAGDPISTIPYIGVVGGMVVVSAGDPSCLTSPNEQDQRHLARMLHLPTLDPSTPDEALAMTRLAFELSEKSQLPVLLRITTRVAHTRAPVRYGRLAAPRTTGFVRDPRRFVPIPHNARHLRQEIPGRLERAAQAMARAGLFRRTGAGRQAILATGAPAATCADLLEEHGLTGEVILASACGVHPLPEEPLAALLAEVDRVLVVEELTPFLEDAVAALCARRRLQVEVLGKRTGHLPHAFEYEPEILQAAFSGALGLGPAPAAAPSFDPVPARPPVLCAGCPHRSAYFAARAVFPEDQLYFNDIGCYTLGYGPPLDAADALLCMGAGFTLAAGVSRVTGQRTVGFIGDATFFHSGMPALLNAVQQDVDMVAVILDNQVTAMTGFQESPTVSLETGPGAARLVREVSIEGVVRALGARHVETFDPTDLQAAILAFERARDAAGLAVVIAESPCPIYEARATGQPLQQGIYDVDPALCRTCGREPCGLRCDQGVTTGYEREMARSRVLAGGADAHGHAPPQPVAPCATQCPLGLCVQGYAEHIAAGQYKEALELIISRTPLPDSVCRVCHHPCEPACVRAKLDEPVAINHLKRFVMDWAAAQPEPPYAPTSEADNGMAVAVVGAGPAGLAAAHDLRLRGYDVTLFDADDRPGGLLRTGIPRFRLPAAALQRDIERILALGVVFRGGAALGRDISLRGLLAEGYGAVFLAFGIKATRPLGVPGEEGEGLPRLVDVLAYLEGVERGETQARGRRVLVFGGGNAAIDAARTALRDGATRVVVAHVHRPGDMPALADEVEEARAEGIELRPHLRPVHVERGEDPGLCCAPFDAGGERDADGATGDADGATGDADGATGDADAGAAGESTIAADLVIVAAGQDPDPSFLGPDDPPLERRPDGTIVVDPETAATFVPRVFAGGDVVGGPATVTGAIAWGQRAAWGIDRSLRGEAAADAKAPPPRPGAWPTRLPMAAGEGPGGAVSRGARARPPELAPADRRSGHREVVGTLTEAQARAEAARCMVCGTCATCRACLDLFGCPAIYQKGSRVQVDPSLCTGCGVCAAFCPNGAFYLVTGAAP